MFDVIVFTQEELKMAIDFGMRSIGLCDNCFILPPVGNMQYTALGKTDIYAGFNSDVATSHGIYVYGADIKFCDTYEDMAFSGSPTAQNEIYFCENVRGYGIGLIEDEA